MNRPPAPGCVLQPGFTLHGGVNGSLVLRYCVVPTYHLRQPGARTLAYGEAFPPRLPPGEGLLKLFARLFLEKAG